MAADASSDAPDADIPLQGTHRGDVDDPITSSVRAQQPPDPTAPAGRVPDDESGEGASSDSPASESVEELGDYRLSRDPASGRYRASLRPPAEESETPAPQGHDPQEARGDFREISRHSSPREMSDALDSRLPDGPRFIVLENTETGEAVVDHEGALSDNWFAGGRYDQVTVFESEDEAAAYVEEGEKERS
ncbi:MAG: hypothetical protein BRD38_00730 [Bacteroidetes bacterium QH_9_67_14]|nr:MAG: hypothetical protein BRD38_00730 [Bacteroidetes bacterium QH_9_67_14]